MSEARVRLEMGDLRCPVRRGAERLPWMPPAEPGRIEVTRGWEFALSPLTSLRRRRLLIDLVINKPPGLRLGVYVPALMPRPKPAIPYTVVERLVVSDEPASRCLGLMDHSLRIPQYIERNSLEERPRGQHLLLQQWAGGDWLTRDDWRSRLRQTRASIRASSAMMVYTRSGRTTIAAWAPFWPRAICRWTLPGRGAGDSIWSRMECS
ncbi:MAG: hypothetical protein KF760_23755 [Candidatus Eremiobacteraeota bacterium]|nr:hypothetical protein [Candidatus Eremiobacteraeota bacterium]MCW5866241.1 hypothetical protein [Candidatus Eremiobacteraeota bacterium]